MTTELQNASVIGLQNETITMQSGEARKKQTAYLSVNTSRGVEMHGVEVWDDNIDKLNLQQGEQVTLSCRLVGRQWGGRWSYNLIAYKADRVDAQQAEKEVF